MAGLLSRVGLHAVSVAALLLIWALLAWWIGSRALPGPLEVFGVLGAGLASGELLHHLGITLYRVFVSFSLAMIIGSAIGLVMGRLLRGQQLFRFLADPVPQHSGAGHHRALLHLVRPDRGRGRSGRGRQQDSQRRRHHARGRTGAGAALQRFRQGLTA